MQLHYIDTVIVRYNIAKVKICVAGLLPLKPIVNIFGM